MTPAERNAISDLQVGDLVTHVEGDGTLMEVMSLCDGTLVHCAWPEGGIMLSQGQLPDRLLVVLAAHGARA